MYIAILTHPMPTLGKSYSYTPKRVSEFAYVNIQNHHTHFARILAPANKHACSVNDIYLIDKNKHVYYQNTISGSQLWCVPVRKAVSSGWPGPANHSSASTRCPWSCSMCRLVSHSCSCSICGKCPQTGISASDPSAPPELSALTSPVWQLLAGS